LAFFGSIILGKKIEKDDDLLTFKSEALSTHAFRAAGVGHAAVVKLLLAANNVLVDVQDRYKHREDSTIYGIEDQAWTKYL
jgi:hypothetical protein